MSGVRLTGKRSIAVVGWGIHLPYVSLDSRLGSDPWVACPPESADELLGRKGLLNKDAATRLALCAVHRALKRPPRAPRPQGPPDPRVAVVASSNLGNMSTVLRVDRTLRSGGLKEISALDAPNASSNVVASTVGIWFRCGGPNLMVCSGATSGLDAVFLGCTLLRSGRADRVIVVGAEPDDPEARAIYARRATPMRDVAFRPGAAAVILEFTDQSTGVPVVDDIRASRGPSIHDDGDDVTIAIGPQAMTPRGARGIDLMREIGDSYGAHGVLQLAVAAALYGQSGAETIAISCGDPVDGWRSVRLRRHVPDGTAVTASHLLEL